MFVLVYLQTGKRKCSSKYKSVSPILVNNVKFSNSTVMTQLVCGSLEVTLRERCL